MSAHSVGLDGALQSRTVQLEPAETTDRSFSVPRLVRDRVTWLHYAQQGALGYFQFGFGPAVLLFRQEADISRTVAGLYGPALAIGAVIGGALFPHLTRRLPPAVVLSIALGGLAAGVAMFCLISSVAGTLIAAVVAMTFGILVLSGVSTGLADHHGTTSAAAISEANAASAGMGIIAPLLINVAVDSGLNWRAALGISIIFAGALAVVTALSHRRSTAAVRLVVDRRHTESAGLPRRYWLAWICLLATGSVEAGLMLWAPEQLRMQTGMTADLAAIGVSAVLGGMLAGRLAGGRVVTRVPTVPLMFAALAVAAAGFAVFWSAADPKIAIAGLICCGLGISLHFPLGVALTMRASNQQSELAMSRNSYGIAFGFGAAPFLLGASADQLGIRAAFGLIPLCLVIAAVSVGQLTRLERRDLM
ncbi:MFS transporter [Nocardia vinacea]|uniref:MFS transporter n=1 Tax=Nocardia vinacea TaxID=96468 RepID=UPI0002F72400|nr:MFS transporter [Nocardia vinacea]